MNSKNISVGDLVYIVSSTSSKVLKNLGPGIVISKTISSPNNIECKSPEQETCVLLWRGEIEEHVDPDWIISASDITQS
jgi:hypothetical protein